MNKCHKFRIFLYVCVWNVFSMQDINVWNIWMNEFFMISITKLWDAKFVIYAS
jgi:hypothetical protein